MADKNKSIPLKDSPIVGRDEEKLFFSGLRKDDSWPRALLLSGAEGIGKKRLALLGAQTFLCQSPSGETGLPCETCKDCKQVKNLTHPDLLLHLPHGSLKAGPRDKQAEEVEDLRSEALAEMRQSGLYAPPESGAAYSLASIYALRQEAQKSASQSNRGKVVILPEAERLSLKDSQNAASNALLKILEDPPGDTHFILTTSRPGELLETIRSRVIQKRVSPLPKQQIKEILTTNSKLPVSEEEMSHALGFSRGSVSRAQTWLNPDWQRERLAVTEVIESAKSGDWAKLFPFIRGDKQSRSSDAVESFINHTTEIAHSELTRRVQSQHSSNEEILAWSQTLEAAMRSQSALLQNTTPRLVMHFLLSQVSQVFSSPKKKQRAGVTSQ